MHSSKKLPLTNSPEDAQQDRDAYLAAPTARKQYRIGLRYLKGKGLEKNERIALIWLTGAAKAGYRPAQFMLGRMLQNGIGTERDLSEALAHYQQAAENGSEKAQLNIAKMYCFDFGIPEQGIATLEQLAAKNNVRACFILGRLYEKGIANSLSPNLTQALMWYHKAHELGYGNASFALSKLYHPKEEKGIPHELEKSRQFLLCASERGVSKALVEQGRLYNDPQRSIPCYEKAREKGHPKAPYLLAKAKTDKLALDKLDQKQIRSERKNPEELEKEIKEQAMITSLYQESAEAKYKPSQIALAARYEKSNPELAIKWYRCAADVQDPTAQFRLAILLLHSKSSPQSSRDEVINLLKKAASRGYIPALHALYEIADSKECLPTVIAAAEAGCFNSQYKLGLDYYLGNEVPLDRVESARLLRKASEYKYKNEAEKSAYAIIKHHILIKLNDLSRIENPDPAMMFHIFVVEITQKDYRFIHDQLNELAAGKQITVGWNKTEKNKKALQVQKIFDELFNKEPAHIQTRIEYALDTNVVLALKARLKRNLEDKKITIAQTIWRVTPQTSLDNLKLIFQYDDELKDTETKSTTEDLLQTYLQTVRNGLCEELRNLLKKKVSQKKALLVPQLLAQVTQYDAEEYKTALPELIHLTNKACSLFCGRVLKEILGHLHRPHSTVREGFPALIDDIRQTIIHLREPKNKEANLLADALGRVLDKVPRWEKEVVVTSAAPLRLHH